MFVSMLERRSLCRRGSPSRPADIQNLTVSAHHRRDDESVARQPTDRCGAERSAG
jgi:hypothetical protein